MSNVADVREVQEFFFESELNGYAIGAPGKSLPDMPGYKEIRYRGGDFLMINRWSKTVGSNKSGGTKTIFFKDVPVWWMSFAGWYAPEARYFLKEALRTAHQAHRFVGGRGDEVYTNTDEKMVYVNNVTLDSFLEFQGFEAILKIGSLTRMGMHKYCGMSLL